MEVADVSNDTRGWIMCIVSGIACVMGACVICVDLAIRYLPGKQDFRIQDSNVFLACSLSLSFGVMIFSALFSMLPEAKEYLRTDEWDESRAGLIMMGCFVAGFVGIQVISRLLHRIMPSHVVDCDHSHDNALEDHKHSHSHSHAFDVGRETSRSQFRTSKPRLSRSARSITTVASTHGNGHTHHSAASESTPLLQSHSDQPNGRPPVQRDVSAVSDSLSHFPNGTFRGASRRPSMMDVRNRVVSFVKDTKATCDADGPCFGYSDPCGQECFKHLSTRSKSLSAVIRSNTLHFSPSAPLFERVSEANSEEDSGTYSPMNPHRVVSHAELREPPAHHDHPHDPDHDHGHGHRHSIEDSDYSCDQMSESSYDLERQESIAPHHHHVPTNAFLAIGLQTVIAIALHKFPEGFITYATNHANPQLGFNVFMALFVHNIAEGFSMALPLYMALGSRLRAIAWSSLLGGLSQPLGAGVAWLVLKIVGAHWESKEDVGIDNTAYAVLFATTAGIMVSVALQLFVESLSINHNRNLSIAFAFLGMVLLGVSNAIAGHSH